MNRQLKTLLNQTFFGAVVYMGWGLDLEGARNVAATIIWTIGLLLGLAGMFSTGMHKKLAEEPPTWASVRVVTLTIAWGTLVTLLWQGWIATGIVYGIYMLGSAVARQQASQLRAKEQAC